MYSHGASEMILTCPNCRKTLKAPDSAAGKKIRCPGCLEIIPIPAVDGGTASTSVAKPAAKPTPPSASLSAAPSGRPANPSSAAGSKPKATSGSPTASAPDGTTGGARSTGPTRPKSKQTTTKLVQAWSYIGTIVVFFSMIAIGVIVALTRSGGGGGIGPSEVGIMFAGLGLILLIPLGIAILVGYVLCVFVPPKSNARTPMIIALVLSVLMFLFSILEAVGTAFNSPGAVFTIAGLRLVMWIVQIVWVMQLFLMFRLGTAMKNY